MKLGFSQITLSLLFIGFGLGSFAADSTAPSATTAQVASPTSGGSESLPSEDFDSLLKSGLKSYQEGKFDLAVTHFQKAFEQQPKNISVLTNLALAQFQNGQKAWAVALLRRAHFLDPDFSTAIAAQEFIQPQLEVREIPHEILWSEVLHARLLSPVPLFWFSCLAALFIFAAGWSLLSFLGQQRRAKTQEIPPASFSLLTVIFLLGALAFSTLLVMKAIDQSQMRATIIGNAKVNVLSSPDESAPSLFELYPGLEVFIDKSQNQWVQVTYPGGPTGWLPKSTLFITTEN